MADTPAPASHKTNFLKNIIHSDLEKHTNEPRHWRGKPGVYSEQVDAPEDSAKVRLRFPPEPNGYLHVGHAKSICLNFGLAKEFGGRCHMRFDDTNPVKEDQEYVDSILGSVRWLGFDWKDDKEDNYYFASDYFDYMYQAAENLIENGFAYVDRQSAEEIKENRGNLHEPGVNSPYRDTPPEENLRLFREMREGKHPEGSMVLRSKIDMASKNINLRDPAIYRIRFAEHHRTGNKWCIYPMYTYAHPLEDVLENITHSICTLEFEDQRAFYNWTTERTVPVTRIPQFKAAIEHLNELKTAAQDQRESFVKACVKFKWKLGQTDAEREMLEILNELKDNPDEISQKANEVIEKIFVQPEKFTPLLQEVLSATVKPNFFLLPHQYEFNRLNLTSVVMSKRKLISLVKEGLVDGWDDPRMPTLVGLRRRGYSPEAMRLFCERVGVSKQTGGWIDYSLLENSLREVLDSDADRRIAVQRPIKLVIDNWPEGKEETVESPNHPLKPERGTRPLLFNGELWIEEDDFSETPPKGYRRLTLPSADGTPGQAVRLRHAYVIRATSVERDKDGNVTTVHAEYYPDTKSGTPGANSVKAKAAIHWLTTKEALPAEIRLYDRLFTEDQPDEGGKDFRELINKDSKKVLHSYVEPSLKEAKPEDRFQFERNGYYSADQKDFSPERLVFNLSVPLKESFKMPPKK